MFITSFGEQNITYKCCSNFLIHLYIVVALIDNSASTIKRLMITNKMSKSEIKEIFGDDNYPLPELWLKAENPNYNHIIPDDSQTISVWGVVTFNLKRIHHRS